MIQKLTDIDKKLLPPKKQLQSFGERLVNVENFEVDGFDVYEYTKDFLIRRGIESPKIMHPMVAEFSNVDMHIDNLSPIRFGTLVLMLTGEGSLIYTVRSKIKDNFECKTVVVKKDYGVVFDFHLPHQFKCHGENCVAILADVERCQLEQLS
jgi:hypothetical protein